MTAEPLAPPPEGAAPRQIHLMPSTREHYLDRHRFYAEQIHGRLFAQFGNIKGEAEVLRNDLFREMAKYQDAGESAESAQEQAVEHYELLSDLRRQLLLAALAGIFHQWERDLRSFLENEFSFYQRDEDGIEKKVWKPDITAILKILARCGWDCTEQPFYQQFNVCRLIVNTYKHGRGSSFQELIQLRPDLFHHPLADMGEEVGQDDWFGHEWLEITEAQFQECAEALEQFWVTIPEVMSVEHGIIKPADGDKSAD